jgi:hypothetical protein
MDIKIFFYFNAIYFEKQVNLRNTLTNHKKVGTIISLFI